MGHACTICNLNSEHKCNLISKFLIWKACVYHWWWSGISTLAYLQGNTRTSNTLHFCHITKLPINMFDKCSNTRNNGTNSCLSLKSRKYSELSNLPKICRNTKTSMLSRNVQVLYIILSWIIFLHFLTHPVGVGQLHRFCGQLTQGVYQVVHSDIVKVLWAAKQPRQHARQHLWK